MCFSTGASIAAGCVLTLAGVTTLRQTRHKSQVAFAAIPLLFAVQQFSEAVVWLSLTSPDFIHWQSFSTSLFLIFAQVVWPLWVPVSVLSLENNPARKKILRILTGIGIIISSYLAWCLVNYPVRAEIEQSHIHYILDFPLTLAWISGVLYFISTVIPTLVASFKKVAILGFTILTSYIFTKFFYENYLISVWCFFAAVISAVILYIIVEINKPAKIAIVQSVV
ncbi:MAG: hypothetical protein IPP71_09800 [Bacteroidetes bacterium]|nr:hypothetical protein [Bacteroidota bacterium]